ncbi:ABC transporter permease [Amnibacterium kyonggiense]
MLGVLVCWALTAARPDGFVRAVVDSASSVFAQFGGVMLAFAWIATLGTGQLIPVVLKAVTGIDINSGGSILYTVPGLLFPYVYFGLPLMVLSFMPAMDGLRPQWGEAVATLGGTRLHYWLRVGVPVLAPAFFGSLILLFANAFSSYATAAALISQGGIITLAIKQQLTSETIVGVANTAGVLALGMVVIMAVLMTLYSALERRTRRWQR